jgi:outer membrane protein TolC
MLKTRISFTICLVFLFFSIAGAQPVLTLKGAVEKATQNYGTIKAKNNYALASKSLVEQAKRDYLPNLNFGFQQAYGTVNGQNGPLYGFGGLSAASSGLPLPDQNWNAAFGALYLTNVNWDFFTFGRAKQKVTVAKAVAERDNRDLQQEVFQQQVKVTAVYLNLLAAHQISFSYKRNLDRADTLRRIVQARAMNGLVAGVDSSLANADFSNAKILLTRAIDAEQQLKNDLTQLLGTGSEAAEFTVDTSMLYKAPVIEQFAFDSTRHPLLQLSKSRIAVSDEQARLIKKSYYPAFSVVGLIQTRGSGFESGYSLDQHNYNKGYFDGIKPTRTNYLVGLGATWNITQVFRLSKQYEAQKFVSRGLSEENTLVVQQVKLQQQLAATKSRNAISVYQEAPVQVRAASDAYLQKTVLYRNGLTNLVDVAQAAYTLVRAETDRDVAINNIWQALLLEAAAAGDYSVFQNQLQ